VWSLLFSITLNSFPLADLAFNTFDALLLNSVKFATITGDTTAEGAFVVYTSVGAVVAINVGDDGDDDDEEVEAGQKSWLAGSVSSLSL